MTEPILPPLKPIPIKDRVSVVFLEKGNLDVLDGAFVVPPICETITKKQSPPQEENHFGGCCIEPL